MPLTLIPDPYECHASYSAHFQNEILNRLSSLDVNVCIVDSSASYESGLYDFAKEIVFTKMEEIEGFCKNRFPTYKMKKIYWPLCPQCHSLEATNIKSIKGDDIEIICSNCKSDSTVTRGKIKGKFGGKIDTAVKWNVFHFDFEPFSKAYLDPDVGTYVIAKSLSEKFFGGNAPEIIEYGQVLMGKTLSYTLLPSLPKNVFRSIFLQKRKRDITLTEGKIIQATKECAVDEKNSFYDYVTTRLPHEILEGLDYKLVNRHSIDLLLHGSVFAKQFLKRDVLPKLPQENFLNSMDSQAVHQTLHIFNWIVDHKIEYPNETYDLFAKSLNKFLKDSEIGKANLFPFIRKLFSLEEGIPLSRVFFFLSLQSLYAYLFIIERPIKSSPHP
jgi:hypothetical protein